MTKPDLEALETHFEFGENWRDYLAKVDEDAIREGERGLSRLLSADSIAGSRFLDIGCGSGLHSLAAVRLGVRELVALDIDPNSVAATRELLAMHAPDASVSVRELSVFDAEPDTLGQFDIVYSWGVLHHTGAMWKAVEHAARLVRPGGLFAIALYQKRATCAAWAVEKKLYTRSGKPVRKMLRGAYKLALLSRLAATGTNPWRYVRDYKTARGMNFHNDVHDWLGGFPYESATPDEVTAQFAALGFDPVVEKALPRSLGLFGTGCAEYTFRRR